MTRILVGPIFLIVFLLALAAPSVEGQVNSYLDATGVPTFTTAMPVEAGFINLANGNMHLEIPIASYPQRGKTSYSARMAFDSRVWKINPTAINGGPQWQPSGGWSLTAGPGGGSATYTYNQANPVCQKGVNRYQTTKYQGFYWQETNGTYHNFLITLTNNYACPQNNVASAAAYATDNSGYYMSVVNYGQTIPMIVSTPI